MPVLPEVQQMVDGVERARAHRPSAAIPVAERRGLIHAGMDRRAAAVSEPVPAVEQKDHVVAVAGGTISVRVYRPLGRSGAAQPGHVYVHGGGWWLGTLDHRDALCAWRAVEAGCVVASVAPRLAPEHRYPVPVEDVYAALGWFVDRASDFGVDTDQVSIGGDSSGVNLAAGAALMSRDRGGPTLTAQPLEIPALDLTMSQPAVDDPALGLVITRDELAEQIDDYCDADLRAEPYASPLLAPDLSGLPATLIMTAEYDLLRDDGAQSAQRLRDAGVPAQEIRWAGHVPGSHELTRQSPSAREWRTTANEILRRAATGDVAVLAG